MSVPKVPKAVILLAPLVGATIDRVRSARPTPIPVKTTRDDEVIPARRTTTGSRGRGADSGRPAPSISSLTHATVTAFKVNRRDQAYGGGIDGTRLAYQLIRGQFADNSDLRLFDLATSRQRPLPTGVNTTSWECCARRSPATGSCFSRGRSLQPADSSPPPEPRDRRAARARRVCRQRGGPPRRRRSTGTTPCGPAATPTRSAGSSGTTSRPARRRRCPSRPGRSPTPLGQPVRDCLLRAARARLRQRRCSS